jgi:hypothetical protein
MKKPILGASSYLRKSKIPKDFPDILQTFVIEVLRDNPESIVDFGAKYFSCLDKVLNNHYNYI